MTMIRQNAMLKYDEISQMTFVSNRKFNQNDDEFQFTNKILAFRFQIAQDAAPMLASQGSLSIRLLI